MRSVIYGTLITAFLVSAGTVEAANDLDGKALLCKNELSKTNPYHGFVFDAGKVTKWVVNGYSKVNPYTRPLHYTLKGLNEVYWEPQTWLNRQTLIVSGLQCKISSKKEIFLKLDEIIADAKKKNKI